MSYRSNPITRPRWPCGPQPNWQGRIQHFLLPQHPVHDIAREMLEVVQDLNYKIPFSEQSQATIIDTVLLLRHIINDYESIHDKISRRTNYMRRLEQIREDIQDMYVDSSWNDNDLGLDMQVLRGVKEGSSNCMTMLNAGDDTYDQEIAAMQRQWEALMPRWDDLLDEDPQPGPEDLEGRRPPSDRAWPALWP